MNISLFHALDADAISFKFKAGAKPQQLKVTGCSVEKFKINENYVYLSQLASGSIKSGVIASAVFQMAPMDLVISLAPCGDISGKKQIGSWYNIRDVIGWQMGRNADIQQVDTHRQTWGKLGEGRDLLGGMNNALGKIGKGKVISGDAFVASSALAYELSTTFDASLIDMNSMGLAIACELAQIRDQLHLRVISDGADESAGDDFQKFTETYQGTGGSYCSPSSRLYIIEFPATALYFLKNISG